MLSFIMKEENPLALAIPDRWKPWVATALVVGLPGIVSALIGLVVFCMSYNILTWME